MIKKALKLADITQQLDGLPAMKVEVLEQVTSTNDWAIQRCQTQNDLPYACLAEEQLSGRGRRGKVWSAGSVSNISMSLVYALPVTLSELSTLPLVVAVAVAESLQAAGLTDVQIKWPNDILVSGEKIAGILVETVALKGVIDKEGEDMEQQCAVVIGIGVNYDMSLVKVEGLSSLPVTDYLTQAVAPVFNRSVLAGKILASSVQACLSFPQSGKRAIARYQEKYDYCQSKDLDILLDSGEKVSGRSQGLSEDAALIVTVDGVNNVFYSADVSVRVTK